MFSELIDIKENDLLSVDLELLNILLHDNSSNKNIIWATDNYEKFGEQYKFESSITIESITGKNGEVIKPRIKKTSKEQLKRIKDKAEVFTPSWICNEQNNLADDDWFGYKNVFNKSVNKTWITNYEKIVFKAEKKWTDYIESLRMEISCGEGPYLISRYDTVTGNAIDVKDRIGLLDRKLRIVSENIDDEENWIEWATKSVKSIYGYDWQGDNVLLARENALFTFIDFYIEKFNKKPSIDLIKEIGVIISWNIWQMDGIKFIIPNSCKNVEIINYTLFGEEIIKTECIGCKNNNNYEHNGIYCKIMNWNKNKAIKFCSIVSKK